MLTLHNISQNHYLTAPGNELETLVLLIGTVKICDVN